MNVIVYVVLKTSQLTSSLRVFMEYFIETGSWQWFEVRQRTLLH